MNFARLFRLVALGGTTGLLAAMQAAASGTFELFPKPDLQTIVVTDVTPEGRAARVPTRDHPVYYVAVSAGFHDFGGSWPATSRCRAKYSTRQ